MTNMNSYYEIGMTEKLHIFEDYEPNFREEAAIIDRYFTFEEEKDLLTKKHRIEGLTESEVEYFE
jgi:hypothetical protein